MKALFGILPRYMNRNFLVNFLMLLGLLLFIVFIFDLVELTRRGAKKDVPFGLIFQMTLLKLPEVGQLLLPFAILFSAMFTFWRLNRSSQLHVMRAAGQSAMNFILPLLFAAFCLGALATTVINPVSSVLLSQFETLENKHIRKNDSPVLISRSGIWLRQAQEANAGYDLMNAGRLDTRDWSVQNVIVLSFDETDEFVRRIEAKGGTLTEGAWVLNDVTLYGTTPVPSYQDSLTLPTDLSAEDILETFSSIENISFWKMQDMMTTLQNTGFSTKRLEVEYMSLLARPFFFAAMILLAATVSLRPMRQGGTIPLVLSGVAIGFLLFFFDSMLKAFGISEKIPTMMSAWTPTIVSILLGTSYVLKQEDG